MSKNLKEDIAKNTDFVNHVSLLIKASGLQEDELLAIINKIPYIVHVDYLGSEPVDSDETGLDDKYFSKILNGMRQPNREVVEKIAAGLRVGAACKECLGEDVKSPTFDQIEQLYTFAGYFQGDDPFPHTQNGVNQLIENMKKNFLKKSDIQPQLKK